jgi:hypothetical protein
MRRSIALQHALSRRYGKGSPLFLWIVFQNAENVSLVISGKGHFPA